jgi:hypothetical protein
MTYKNRRKLRDFMFLIAGCFLLRAEGFSCSLDVLYGGLGKSILQFLIKKILHFFSCNFFLLQFLVIKPWIMIGMKSKMLDPDPESETLLYLQ